MEPEFKTAAPPPLSFTAGILPDAPASPPSPWEDFLVGKKVAPEKFLAAMSKGAITLPDDGTRQRFVETLLAKPDRMARFIPLLQASAAAGETLRKIVAGFAEAAIRRLQLIAISEPLDAGAFNTSVSSWLASIRKKPLAPPDLNRLFLLLHFGALRQVLDHNAAFALVASAVAKSGKSSRKSGRVDVPQTPLDMLLAATPSRPVLTTLAAYAKVTDRQTVELNQQIAKRVEEIAQLQADATQLKRKIADLENEVATLKEEKGVGEQRLRELERQVVDIRDGYQHKLDALRGRIRGVLQGQLTRWIETALDAARSEPPFTQAIQERLEDVLKLIEKEVLWLQPSA